VQELFINYRIKLYIVFFFFFFLFQEEQVDTTAIQKDQRSENNVDFRDVLRSSILRRCFILTSLIWICTSVVYSGLAFNSGNLGMRDQTSFLIGATVETFGYLASWWAMDRYGRRRVIWTFLLFGGVSCISCAFVPVGKCAWYENIYLNVE
jgi:Na+/melibiose symporter-like transporter